MTPLVVTAEMSSPVEWRYPPMLDGILAKVVAMDLGLSAPRGPEDCTPIDIPIELESGGRFHLASQGHVGEPEFCRTEYIHKRPIVRQMIDFGPPGLRRMNLKAGEDKAWRVPCPGEFYRLVTWWCIGDQDSITKLLNHVVHLGGRRRHGCGRVERWSVDYCAPWVGFPVMRDGLPLRPLPTDWPGVRSDTAKEIRNITYPYFLRGNQELLRCPS